jgi:hypothetical protein
MTSDARLMRTALVVLALMLAVPSISTAGPRGPRQAAQADAAGWQPLFDGRGLEGWTPTRFVGQGKVTVSDGRIVLGAGQDMTGITWSGATLPTSGYELALEAMRVQGSDFFAGITFPVGDSFCSLILGGWGGMVIGLSSVDGMDASENTTSQSTEFKAQQWYRVRIRVTDAAVEVWLDDKHIIEQKRAGVRIHTREEMDPSKPLGIATWRTTGALRAIRLKRL